MRKAAVLFLVGLSPFLLGWLLSLGMTTIFAQMGAWFYIVVGLAVLTLWMVVSGTFGFKGSKRGMALTMLCINLPALVVLVLLGVQELSLHAYWDNAVGLLTQFFYLPLCAWALLWPCGPDRCSGSISAHSCCWCCPPGWAAGPRTQ